MSKAPILFCVFEALPPLAPLRRSGESGGPLASLGLRG